MSMRSKALHISIAFFLLAALSFLYWFLFILPFVPIKVNNIGDSLLNLAPGQRMYQGEMIYRDVFEFLTPGTALINFLMFKLFGLRPWIPNVLALLLGLGLAWLGIVISKTLVRPSLVFLPSAIFLVSARAFLTDPNHHWYSAVAAIAGIAVLIERRTPARILVAGFLCGISACFTQTSGLAVVVGFAVFLSWESRQRQEGLDRLRRKAAWLLTGFLAALLAVNGYFVWEAGPARYFWCTVIFVLKYHHKAAYANSFQVFLGSIPAFLSLRTFLGPFAHWLLLFVFTPFILILFFVRYWRESSQKPLDYWERPMLVAIVGVFMLLSIAPAPGEVRMVAGAFPELILLGWFLDSSRRLARTLVAAITGATLLMAIQAVVAHRPHPVGILALPFGKLAFDDPTAYQEYVWIEKHTQPTEYFYELDLSDHYFYLDLRNPTPLPYIENNGYTTTEQVSQVIRGLEKHQVRYVLCGVGADDLSKSPELDGPSKNYLGPLWVYIHTHYSQVEVFPGTAEIWERKTE